MSYLSWWPHKLLSLFLLGVFFTSNAYATNGVFLIGYGAKSRAMGGTAIANPQSILASASNPALLTEMKDHMAVGADLFRPRSYARLGTTRVVSGAKLIGSHADNLFVMPGMGGVMKLSKKIYAGMTMIPAGGGGTNYKTNLYNAANGTDESVELESELFIMQINPTVSYKFNKNHSFGVTLVLGAQRFRAQGLNYFSNFTSGSLNQGGGPNQDLLTDRGIDWAGGAGLRFGWIGKFMKKKLLLGVSASSKVYMSKFKKYKDLFPHQGDLDTPPIIGFGASYKFNKKFTVAMDVSYIYFQHIPALSNQGPSLPGAPNIFPNSKALNATGQDHGLGFGWDNQAVYEIGLSYKYNKKWTLRAGWNYGKSPIDEKEDILFNILAPVTTQNHLTLGGSYALSRSMGINFAYVHAYEFIQNGPTFIGGATGGEIGMSQDSISIGFDLRM